MTLSIHDSANVRAGSSGSGVQRTGTTETLRLKAGCWHGLPFPCRGSQVASSRAPGPCPCPDSPSLSPVLPRLPTHQQHRALSGGSSGHTSHSGRKKSLPRGQVFSCSGQLLVCTRCFGSFSLRNRPVSETRRGSWWVGHEGPLLRSRFPPWTPRDGAAPRGELAEPRWRLPCQERLSVLSQPRPLCLEAFLEDQEPNVRQRDPPQR